jgi:hypothetical protein
MMVVPAEAKGDMAHLLRMILDLIRTYVKFIKYFSMKYVPKELFEKLCLCLKIVRLFALANHEETIRLLTENIVQDDFTTLLELDDTFEVCRDSLMQSQQ